MLPRPTRHVKKNPISTAGNIPTILQREQPRRLAPRPPRSPGAGLDLGFPVASCAGAGSRTVQLFPRPTEVTMRVAALFLVVAVPCKPRKLSVMSDRNDERHGR